MNMNDLSLDPFLLATLFPGPLYPESGVPVPETANPASSHVRGKGILVLYSDKAPGPMAPDNLSLLNNILGACGLDPGKDIDLLNLSAPVPGNWEALVHQFEPRILIYFGREALGLFPFPIQKYIPDPSQVPALLWADGLDQLNRDKHLKQRLWASLKSLFQIP